MVRHRRRSWNVTLDALLIIAALLIVTRMAPGSERHESQKLRVDRSMYQGLVYSVLLAGP